jgi:magnesium-dependent phosphatase 1
MSASRLPASAASSGSAALAAPPGGEFPPLVVFDLDWTLWPLDVDTDTTPPYTACAASGAVTDSTGAACALYPDVRAALARLAAGGSAIAYASRTTDPAAAEALLRAHGLWAALRGERALFQAYPSGGGGAAKTRHFARIHEASGCSAADTLFFDDMADNVAVASRAGVTCVLLPRGGLTAARLEEGLQAWRRARAAGGR